MSSSVNHPSTSGHLASPRHSHVPKHRSFTLSLPYLRLIPALVASIILYVATGAASSLLAQSQEVNSVRAKLNEDIKVEAFSFFDFKISNTSQEAKLQVVGTVVETLCTVPSGASSQWQKSPVRKHGDELYINYIYQTPKLRSSNVEQYVYHIVVPEGYEVFYRPAGTEDRFAPGSALASSLFEAVAFDFVVMKTNESGALPGKQVAANGTDGAMRFALGFLPSGQSAGFLDFIPVPDYTPIPDPFGAVFTYPLGSTNLRTVSLSDEVEIITQPMSTGTARGMRQIVAPQAIIDVSRDGFDLLVKYYRLDQRGTRRTEEPDAYSSNTLYYPAGKGPYELTGTPFISYRVAWSIGDEWIPSTAEQAITVDINITRTEGADVKNSSTKIKDIYRVSGMHYEYEPCPNEDCYGGYVEGPCDTCDGAGEVITGNTCDTCGGDGREGENDCGDCDDCYGTGYEFTICTNCLGDGTDLLECDVCEGAGEIEYQVPADFDDDHADSRIVDIDGFGVKKISRINSAFINRAFPEQTIPTSNWNYGNGIIRDTEILIDSSLAKSTHFYEGGFPLFNMTPMIIGGTVYQYYQGATQKLISVKEGDSNLTTNLGYYRLSRSDPLHASHHERLKWQTNSDGGWQMFDYSTDLASLGQVTKTVSPYLDTVMPTELPSGSSVAGYRITTHTYTDDWEGVKRLPDTITETANGQQVGYTNYDYSTGSANGQPLWITTTQSYTSNGVSLTSTSKVYQGMTVATWLRGLPYSAEGPDGNKVSMAYYRGTWNDTAKTFTTGTGAALRAVSIKGSARSDSNGTLTSTYDGMTIDSVYLVANVSTASVTIRDASANTVRTETHIYNGSGWDLVGSADMQYDVGGNLIRRQELNGGIYEAIFTDINGLSTTFSAISFNNNSGNRTGRKEYERDAQGLITKFYYDTKGRVNKTVRLATPACTAAPSGVPAITTLFEFDDENRITKTTLTGTAGDGSDDLISTKTYNRAGQVLSETAQGLTTSYNYLVTDGILTQTTVTLPGGATRILKNYKDGRPESITGTAGPAEYYTYSVDSGREVTTKYLGTNNGQRWVKTYEDWAGRTVRTETSGHNGTAAATLAQTAEFNSRGQQVKTQTAGLAPVLYFYDANGVMTESGTDLNSDGNLDTNDRRQKTGYGFRHEPNVWSRYGGDNTTWWSYSESFAFPDGETAGKRVSRTWTRATHFSRVSGPQGIAGDAIAETVTADANDNRTVTQTFLDRATGTVSTVIYSPFAAQPSIAVAVAERVVSATSPAGVTTQTVYDSVGRAIKSIDRTSSGYSGNNTEYYPGTTRVKSVTDNRGVRQHLFTYELTTGRLIADTTPKIDATTGATSGYNTSRFAYNTFGQLTHTWGDVPYPVKYDYDATTGEKTAQYTYRTGTAWTQSDLATSGSWPADSTGDKTRFEYYPQTGMLHKKIDAANREVVFTYNLRGQTLTATSSRNIVRNVEYSSTTGEMTRVYYTGESGYTTPEVNYTYDRLGRTKTITDATGARTFTYRSTDLQPESEQFGRLNGSTTSHVLGTTRQFNYLYEAGTGRAIGLELANNSVSEYSVNYGFDPVSSRLKSITSGAGVFHYGYLANSNLISSVTSGTYVQSRTFETNRNALTSLTVDTAAGRIAGYTYAIDDLGRRRWQEQSGSLYGSYVTGAEVMRTVYGYDDRNEVTSAETKVGASGTVNAAAYLPGRGFGYDYDSIGNRKTEKFDGVSHTYNANNLNQYTSRNTPSYLPVSGTANNSGGATLSINGNALGSGNWRNNYFYLAVNKAQTANPGYQTINFSAAASGGGTTQTETASSLTRPLTETFTYDLDGNLTEDGLWHYVYDGENRLRAMYGKVADATGSPAAVIFTYDYMGRRILKTSHSYSGTYPSSVALTALRGKTYFAYQGWRLVAEYDDNSGSIGALRRRFTWGAALAGTADVGSLLAIEDLRSAFSGTYHAVHDGNGNLTALAAAAGGATVAEYEYDPFGNLLRSSGRYGKENPFRFAGKYLDVETGLHYYGFRYYSASLGRFINRDPIGEAGGLNIYGFANNDGINGGDLFGLAWYNPFSWNWKGAYNKVASGFKKAGTAVKNTFTPKSSERTQEAKKVQPSTSVSTPTTDDIIELEPLEVRETREKPKEKSHKNKASKGGWSVADSNPGWPFMSGDEYQAMEMGLARGAAIANDVEEYGWAGVYKNTPILSSGFGTVEMYYGETAEGIPLDGWGYLFRSVDTIGSAMAVYGVGGSLLVAENAVVRTPSAGPLKNMSGSVDDAAAAARSTTYRPDTVSTHAKGRMYTRGVAYESIQEAVSKGARTFDASTGKATYMLKAADSSTGRAVFVVRNEQTGNIISVIDKGSK
jgi:RHS repeat-associated protein